jgi:hypothetical protein
MCISILLYYKHHSILYVPLYYKYHYTKSTIIYHMHHCTTVLDVRPASESACYRSLALSLFLSLSLSIPPPPLPLCARLCCRLDGPI